MSLLRAIKIGEGDYLITDAATAIIQEGYEEWLELSSRTQAGHDSFSEYIVTKIETMGLTARLSDNTEDNDSVSIYKVLELGTVDTQWVQFLTEKGICSADEEGSMPCDYGNTCDRCGAPWIQEDYELWLLGKADEAVAKAVNSLL